MCVCVWVGGGFFCVDNLVIQPKCLCTNRDVASKCVVAGTSQDAIVGSF